MFRLPGPVDYVSGPGGQSPLRAMRQALVSIVIPCFNAERWLAQTLDSALAQTWPHCEVIVVDDGSRDRSRAIAQAYAPRGVRMVQQVSRGASAARNAGWAAARGDYVQWLDADDLLSPDKIGSQVRMLEGIDEPMAATCRWLRFRKHPAERLDEAMPVFRDFDGFEFVRQAAATGAMMHPAAWLLPRALAAAAGPWDERLSLNDDGEYFARVALAAKGIRFSAQGEVYVRSYRQGSLSKRRDEVAITSQFLSVELITRHLLARDDSAATRRACADLYQRSIYRLHPLPERQLADAQRRVGELGGSELKPALGPRAALLARLFGLRGLGYLRRLRAALQAMGRRTAA